MPSHIPLKSEFSSPDPRARRKTISSEKERLISQIEGRAFLPIIPLLPKPWLELKLSDGIQGRALRMPRRMDNEKGSLKRHKLRGVKVAVEKEGAIPIPSGKIGSLFVRMSPCPSRCLKRLLKEGHRVLKREGKIVIGFIPRNSPWGKFYSAQKKREYPPHRGLGLHSLKEMEHRIMQAGFSIQGISSTLFQKPGELKVVENPMINFHPQAGFLVLIGEKRE